MAKSKYYHFSKTGPYWDTGSREAAFNALDSGGFIWLNLFEPTKEELTALVEPLGIHPLSVEDCLDASQVPKIEHFPRNSFIIFNSFQYVNSELYIDEVDIIIGENYLVTVSGFRADGREPMNGVESLIDVELDSARKGPAFLMHIILDHIVDGKFHAIESVEDELEQAEESVLEEPEKFNPAHLIRLRRHLLNLRKSLFHEREILVKICRLDSNFITDKVIFHYRDIYDHLTKFLELTESYREIVTSLMELYTSLLNNIMTRSANQTNLSVRRLTLIATIFMPLTLLASIGGMSEWTMITGADNWKIAYPLFLLGMAVIGLVTLVALKKLEKKGIKD
ncbi:MAG: magnesium transporter CorA family protein [Bacteroidales bacterium]